MLAKVDMVTLAVSYIDLTEIKEDLCGFAGGFSGNFDMSVGRRSHHFSSYPIHFKPGLT
jgi:hypothetical protein